MNPGTCKISKPKASVFFEDEAEDVEQEASSHKRFNSCWFSQNCIQGGCHTFLFSTSTLSLSASASFTSSETVFFSELFINSCCFSQVEFHSLSLSASGCYIPLICCCFTYKPFSSLFLPAPRCAKLKGKHSEKWEGSIYPWEQQFRDICNV